MTKYKLKSINQLFIEFPKVWDIFGDDINYPEKGWIINSIMKEKFGNNKSYNFRRIGKINHYTHSCIDDGFTYHESWFVEKKYDINLEDDLFTL